MEIFEGTIKRIDEKTGISKKTGEEWKLYKILVDDMVFSTFNEILLIKDELADKLINYDIGDEVRIEYELVEKNGFTNNRLHKINLLGQQKKLDKIYEEKKEKFKMPDEEDLLSLEIILGEKRYKGMVRRIE